MAPAVPSGLVPHIGMARAPRPCTPTSPMPFARSTDEARHVEPARRFVRARVGPAAGGGTGGALSPLAAGGPHRPRTGSQGRMIDVDDVTERRHCVTT